MSTLLKVGRLISTTDMKLARHLNEVVNVSDITKGRAPQAIEHSGRNTSFMLAGDFYELAAA